MALLLLLLLVAWLLPAGPARAQDTDQLRFYLALRGGVQRFTDAEIAPGAEATEPQFAYGASVGFNLGRHLGFEVAGDGYEAGLRVGGRKVGEYAVWTVIPQVRLRSPLLDGALTPYALAGVGVGYSEFNDPKRHARALGVRGDDVSVVGAVGGGVEYFVANNIAVGVEARYFVFGGHAFTAAGRSAAADLDGLVAGVTMRILFPEAPPR